MEDLRERGIKATGTLRSNRVIDCPITKCEILKKKERGVFQEWSTGDISIVRWNDNQVVTLASNHTSSAPLSTCKRYSRIQKARINVPQPHVICKYNRYMGGVDLLDGFLNNMRPAVGGKKWYWMQMINLVRLLQVAAFRFYVNLGHETSQLDFLRDIVHSHVTQRQSHSRSTAVPRMTDMQVSHYLTAVTQGRCRQCRKNCRLQCEACGVRLHQNCFANYHMS